MFPYLVILAACAALLWFDHWRMGRRHREDLARTRRELAEAAYEQERQIAAQSQTRQETLFNSMIEGVLLLDTDGRVEWVNDSLRKGCGVAENIKGQTIMEAFRWHELAALSERLPREKTISVVELELQRVGPVLERDAPGVERLAHREPVRVATTCWLRPPANGRIPTAEKPASISIRRRTGAGGR